MTRTPMKRVPMSGILAACLLGSVGFAASAQDAPPTEVDAEAEARAQVESDRQTAEAQAQDQGDADAGVSAEADVDRNCLRYTGSHISTRTLDEKGKDCVNANGRVYSREDIRNTGQTDLADALRMLDPAVF